MRSYIMPVTELIPFVSRSVMTGTSPVPEGDILGTPENVGDFLGGGGTGF